MGRVELFQLNNRGQICYSRGRQGFTTSWTKLREFRNPIKRF